MKTLIELERQPSAPTFIDERGGTYLNPIIKLFDDRHLHDESLSLVFGFYSDELKTKPSMIFTLNFDGDFTRQKKDPNGAFLELGKPSYTKLLEEYLEFGKDGKLYLINLEGLFWFLNTNLCHIPNSLGEINLVNWRFKSVS